MQPVEKSCVISLVSGSDHMNGTLQLLCGAEVLNVTSDISPLLGIYGEWPYLYRQEDPQEDVGYVKERYADVSESVVCIAYQGKRAIGVAMGVPLNKAPLHYQEAFPLAERTPDVFYWGEMVVLPEFRKQHLASQIFSLMGNHVIKSGQYKAICFATVEREENFRLRHLKPNNYVSFDPLWQRHGFEKIDRRFNGKWKLVGETTESLQPMVFWWKSLK